MYERENERKLNPEGRNDRKQNYGKTEKGNTICPGHFMDESGRKTTTLVRDHDHFIPTKFRKHLLSGSVVKADYVFQYIYMH